MLLDTLMNTADWSLRAAFLEQNEGCLHFVIGVVTL